MTLIAREARVGTHQNHRVKFQVFQARIGFFGSWHVKNAYFGGSINQSLTRTLMKTSTMKLWLTTALTLLMTPMFGQLSGTYTINASGSGSSNYTSFGAAVTALSTSGVSGAVTFNVASGTYTEQVTIPAITGASATNTITFQADPANTTAATLTYAPTSSSANWTLRLDGTSYVTIKGLTLQSTGSSYGRILDQYGANTTISIIDNTFDGSAGTSSSSYYAGMYYTYSSTTEAKGNWTITGNTFSDVSYGIYVYGKSYTTSLDTCIIENNTVTCSGSYGMYPRYAKYQKIHNNTVTGGSMYAYYASVGTDIQNNTVSGGSYGVYIYSGAGTSTVSSKPTNTIVGNTFSSTYKGIYVSGSSSSSSNQQGQTTIKDNNISVVTTSSGYGIHLNYVHAGTTAPSLVQNNMVSITGSSSSSIYGFYPYHCQNTNVYHNSVNVTNGSSTSGRAFYINKSTSSWTVSCGNGMVVKNNIFVNTGGGMAAEASSAATPGTYFTSDYNVYNASGSTPFKNAGTSAASLSAWQTATSQDANSVYGDPSFTSATDLHCQGTTANNAGAALGVTTDIDGDTRSTTTPDIGADEFTPLTCTTVSGVTGGNITHNSADVSWSSTNSSPIGGQIRYRVNGTTAYTVVSGTSGSTISSLTASTSYDVSAREICAVGDTGSWSVDASFMTACSPVTSLPMNEGFDSTSVWYPGSWSSPVSVSNCWNIDVTGTPYWNVSNNGSTPSSGTGPSGGMAGQFLYLETSSGLTGASASVELPIVSVSDSIIVVSFDYHMYGATMGNLYVEYYDGSAWVAADSLVGQQQTTQTAAWVTHNTTLVNPAPNGSTKLRLRGTKGSSYTGDMSIDNVVVQQQQCLVPSAVTGTATSSTAATVTWTSANTSPLSHEVRYRALGATAYTSNGTSTTITGLTAATSYEVSVREICAVGDTSAWSADSPFVTMLCDPAGQCQYMIYMTDSWGDGWNGNSVNVTQGGVNVGSFGSTFSTGSSATDSISLCDLSTASFTLNLGSWSQEIGFNIVSAGGDTVLTHTSGSVLTANYNFGSFVAICGSCGIQTAMPYTEDFNAWTTGGASTDSCWTFDGFSPYWTWGSGGTPSSGTGPASSSGTFLFLETSGGSGGEAEAALPAMSFSDSIVNFSFDYHMHGATMGSLYVEYHDGSAWVGADTLVGQQQANQTDAWLSHNVDIPAGGLTRVRFRGTRGTSFTGDMSVDNVTIQPSGCLMPTGVYGTNATMTSLDAAWSTFNGTPLSYEVRYRTAGSSAWTSNGASTTISGLTGATTYEISVREICSAGDTSLWSAVGTGTTLLCDPADQCNYYVYMTDSYGDGWNGNSINFHQSGSNVGVAGVGFTTGSAYVDTVSLCTNDSATVDLNIGTWTSEIGFDVVSSVTGDTLLTHTSGSSLTAGQVFGSFWSDCNSYANVTFQVDMRQVSASFTTPEVNGTWNNWCGNCNAMTDADGDGIWEVTLPLVVGSNEEYKYSADSWNIQEMNDPTAPCTNGNTVYTNRVLTVPANDTVIPVVCWSECDACSIDVTFRVNMEWEVTNSSLADTVHVAGSMQGWNPATSAMDDSDGDGVWEWTTSVDLNSKIWYKFINGNSWGEAEASGDLSGCGQDDGFGGYNRYDSLGVADTVLPIVCFTKCHDCAVSLDEFAADVYVFPNPSNGAFTLERSNLAGTLEVAVMNAQGQLIAVDTWNEGSARHDMDLSAAPAGVYMIRLSSDSGNRTLRVTIQR